MRSASSARRGGRTFFHEVFQPASKRGIPVVAQQDDQMVAVLFVERQHAGHEREQVGLGGLDGAAVDAAVHVVEQFALDGLEKRVNGIVRRKATTS